MFKSSQPKVASAAKKNSVIYALCDPRPDHAECYIGITNDLERRWKDHLKDGTHPKASTLAHDEFTVSIKQGWMSGLISQGLKPVLLVLQEEATPEDELRWIRFTADSAFLIPVNSVWDQQRAQAPLDVERHAPAIQKLVSLYDQSLIKFQAGATTKWVVKDGRRQSVQVPVFTMLDRSDYNKLPINFSDDYRNLCALNPNGDGQSWLDYIDNHGYGLAAKMFIRDVFGGDPYPHLISKIDQDDDNPLCYLEWCFDLTQIPFTDNDSKFLDQHVPDMPTRLRAVQLKSSPNTSNRSRPRS